MINILRRIHHYLYLGSVLFFFMLSYPFLLFFSRNPDRYFHQIALCRRIVGFLSSAFVGIFYRYHYETGVDWSRPCVICPNHTSNLDITALVLLCPPVFSFMGKVELLNNPVTGMFFRTIDIPVNRQSKISSFKAFKRAQENLEKGRSVVIFPEGLIGDEFPPQLYPFKNGPFKLAIDMQIPIVPIVIHDAWKVLWDDGKHFGSRPGVINISILNPVETTELQSADADRLRDQVYEQIKNKWNSTGGL